VVAHAVGDGGTAAFAIDSAAGALECRLRADALVAFADRLAGVGLEVQWIAAADTRATSRHFTLVYHFAPPSHRPAVTASVDVDDAFPSLATRSFAASRFEREIQDLFGLVASGHPDPRRLALHQFWPAGYHPLRRDAVPRTDVVGDVGMILNDTGYAFGHAHCFRLRERLLRLNARLTGHRLLRGAVVAGGVAGPIASADLEHAAREVDRIVDEFLEVARLSLDNTMVLERLQ